MSNVSDKESPLSIYQRDIAQEKLQSDDAQRRVIIELDKLWLSLQRSQPTRSTIPPQRNRLFSSVVGKFFKKPTPQKRPTPQKQGIYIVGKVGRGKTMLMDLFFSTLPRRIGKREHFLDFMRHVHKIVHQLRKQQNTNSIPPIEQVADAIMPQGKVLCLDEFQVTDIADAMILGHLFQALFQKSIIVVMTSNTAISDLFQGRPGADSFKPFIKVMARYLTQLHLDSRHDYRRQHQTLKETWILKNESQSKERFDALFQNYVHGGDVKSEEIHCAGHHFTVQKAAQSACMISFDELCDRPLGAGDYHALAKRFPVVFIDNVPQLEPRQAHIARRFILLIDVLYDNKNLLFIRADVESDKIFTQGEGVELYTRAYSRLTEMGSQKWLAHYTK